MLKFKNHIQNYRYVLSFDLAKQETGWALVDITDNKVVKCGMVILDDKAESPWADVYDKIELVIKDVQEFCKKSNEQFFVLKEKLPNQAGRFTTIASLQGLAQAHAIWELACKKSGAEPYDYDGVHAVSVKAFFKRTYGVEKPQKEDIAKLVCERYGFELGNRPFDITDAIACVQTLVEYKWDADIEDKIKELKKEQKKYKTNKKKNEITEEISRISELEVCYG